MTSDSPVLPALGGFDMSAHPTGISQIKPSSSPPTLPSFATLDTHANISIPGSPISPASISSGDASRDSSNSSMEANSSFNSDEGAGAPMDTARPLSPGQSEVRGQPSSIPPPTWTNRWTSRAPPPKPLVRASFASRRHHPYAPSSGGQSSSRGVTTPSPTWPAHIGIDDGNFRQHQHIDASAPHTAGFFDGVPSPQFKQPTRPARLRSTTVLLPPGRSEPSQDRLQQRPTGPSRHNSYGTAQEKERVGPAAVPAPHIIEHRRSRGNSFATSDSSNSHHSTLPPSPLLFAPLSPSDPVAPPYGIPPQQKGQMIHRIPHGPPGQYSPSVDQRLYAGYEESPRSGPVHLSPYNRPISFEQARRMQPPQLPSPASGLPPTTSGAAHSKVEQWRSGENAQQASSPALERISHSRRRRRPPFSYSSLIAQAISSTPQGRMTLREIYTWISNAYPELYSMDGADSQGWQNTVRHNLSLNKSFVKVARTAQDIYEGCSSSNPAHSQAARGKGGWWTIDPVVAQAQLGPNFRGTGGEISPTDPHHDGRGRLQGESSPEGFSDGEYFPPHIHASGYVVDPSWTRGPSGPIDQRRGSADSIGSGVPSGMPGYPSNYPSVLMRPRPRPASLDQGSMLGYEQHAPSFGRSRGYSNSELAPERELPGKTMQQARPFYPAPRVTAPHSLAPIGQAGYVRHGHQLEVPTQVSMDRDLTPKATQAGQDEDGDERYRKTATPQADGDGRSGRMAISDMLC